MGGRYYITGVQLGMLRVFVKQENESDVNKLLEEIEDRQYLGEREDFEKKSKKK